MTIRAPQIDTFAKNLMAYGASEVAAKLSRLLVVIAIARTMNVAEIGVAAAAIAAGDILKSLTENGVGQRIISARNEDLEATCATAHLIFWAWAIGLCAVQMGIGAVIFLISGNWILLALIAILALEYLFMPAGQVQTALAMREGKLRQTAMISAGQVVGANIMTVALTLVWPSAIALVLPRLLSAPLWLIAMRRLRPWFRDTHAGFAPLTPFVTFGWAVLGVELVKAARLQADKIVIGSLLGSEALGFYFMAFNAGLGLATSFSVAFSTVLFPHLCGAKDQSAALRQGIIQSMTIITPAVILQALLSPIYVPILFGSGWNGISDVVSILCLIAISTTLWSACASWLRSTDRAHIEFSVTVLLTLSLIATTAILAPHGLVAIATGYLIVASVIMFAASVPALIFAFRPALKGDLA